MDAAMNQTLINNPIWFNLLWLVAGAAILIAVGFALRRRALRLFVGATGARAMVTGIRPRLRYAKAACVVAGLVAIVLALADPRWGREWRELPQRGVDVIFVLDVSKSMLADDATPTRLDRAKGFIGDMIDEMPGDRVGLVTYAGSVSQRVPLTSSHQEFMLALGEVGPHSVSRGGSRLGEAIDVAANRFLDQTADHKAIVVISDGEDQNTDPVDAARTAYEDRGIRVYTVGIGDPVDGSRIPIHAVSYQRQSQGYLTHGGEEVITRMDGETLREVALAGGGAYIPAETMSVDMGEVYHAYLAGIAQREFEQTRVNTYIPRFQWFAAAALVLLVVELVLTERRRKAVAA